MRRHASQRGIGPHALCGFTLVELVVSIAVIAIAAGGILLGIAYTTRHSADPVMEQQSINIAEAYLDEIEAQSYFALPNPAGRQNYNDICDYNGLSQPPTDQTGAAVPGVTNYHVVVSVTPCPTSATSTPYAPATISVSVTPPAGPAITISVLRANY
ncbi:MAG: prepilin-type N-terminal cleavage/methylation domain-containing protein [Gammaproteobacteria bacterium]